jgi:hypothetical protein
MVESTAKTDGIERRVMYAKWRDDKPAEEGYSKELVNIDTPADAYDDMDKYTNSFMKHKTILHCFLDTASRKKDEPFMGTRGRNPDGSFGAY